MKQTSEKRRPKIWTLSGLLCLTLSVSACATSKGITGIEPPPAQDKPAQRLSLCELIAREELTYSRADTEGTKLQLGGVLRKYDENCPRGRPED